eukprot:1333684-Pleurochrysis_carterae.AAC.2
MGIPGRPSSGGELRWTSHAGLGWLACASSAPAEAATRVRHQHKTADCTSVAACARRAVAPSQRLETAPETQSPSTQNQDKVCRKQCDRKWPSASVNTWRAALACSGAPACKDVAAEGAAALVAGASARRR